MNDVELFDPDPDRLTASYFRKLPDGGIEFSCRRCDFHRKYGTITGAITKAGEHYIQIHRTKLTLRSVGSSVGPTSSVHKPQGEKS